MAEAWRWARLATFTSKGNKRKGGSAPIPTQPTVAQVVQHLSKPAEKGGSSAQCLHKEETNKPDVNSYIEKIANAATKRNPTKHYVPAEDLLDFIKDMADNARRLKNGKSTVPWDAPAEVYKLLLLPQRQVLSQPLHIA